MVRVILCYICHLIILIVHFPSTGQSVVETPERSQVESTTWPLVGTTCPVGTEYTIIRARQEYLLEGRIDLLDPRYRPNALHHPSATCHTTRAQRVTPQARNFFNRCSVFGLIYKYILNGYFLYFVLCRCAISFMK